MSINVNVKIEENFKVLCSVKQAFEQLSDVEKTASLFPKLDKIVALGDDTWRWEMAPVSSSGISHQVKYTVRYSNDGNSKIDWNPCPMGGNATVSGGWFIKQDEEKLCSITFRFDGEFEMQVPRLIKTLAESFIKTEFNSQVSTFLERIKHELEC